MSTFDALRAEHEAKKAQVREERRTFARSEPGAIERQLREAMHEYERMRREGVSRDDACRGLEIVLRDVFPLSKFGRTCDACEDSGWREMLCWHEQRCGRRTCADRHPADEHRYVVPCECQQGDRHRKRVYTPDDAIAQVGKVTKKRGGFSRVGQ